MAGTSVLAAAAGGARRRLEAAELLVVDQRLHGRMRRRTPGTRDPCRSLSSRNRIRKRVVDQEAADERLADAEDQLDRLGRLDRRR